MIKRCLLSSVLLLTLGGCFSKTITPATCPPVAYPQLSNVENALRDLDKMYTIYNVCAGYDA